MNNLNNSKQGSEISPFNIIKKNGDLWAVDNPEYQKVIEKELYKVRLKYSNIPANYYDLDFKDYQGDKSIDHKNLVVKYAKNCRNEKFKKINLYLTGNNSTQKTMLLCAIGKEFIRQGYVVKFVLAGDLINLLMKSQGFNYEEEIEAEIKKYMQIDLLLIDDIFDTNKSLYWKKSPELTVIEWDRFLRNLISNNIRIVITSNLSMESVEENFGASLYSLVSRNFAQLFFYDNIENVRKQNLNNLFE